MFSKSSLLKVISKPATGRFRSTEELPKRRGREELEGRARALGKLVDVPEWRQRNRELLGWGADGLLGAGVAGRGSTADGGAGSQAAAGAADRADAAGQPRREADS